MFPSLGSTLHARTGGSSREEGLREARGEEATEVGQPVDVGRDRLSQELHAEGVGEVVAVVSHDVVRVRPEVPSQGRDGVRDLARPVLNEADFHLACRAARGARHEARGMRFLSLQFSAQFYAANRAHAGANW